MASASSSPRRNGMLKQDWITSAHGTMEARKEDSLVQTVPVFQEGQIHKPGIFMLTRQTTLWHVWIETDTTGFISARIGSGQKEVPTPTQTSTERSRSLRATTPISLFSKSPAQ